ncbi:MAG TPA: glycoside hydrolase family 19 protein [Patescibacteria group bacterium]|nr:glycoside hydrolase family 19 protein [Patescibacteria group bacterium]
MDGNVIEALRGVIPETRRRMVEARKNNPPRQMPNIDWSGRYDRFGIRKGAIALGVSAGIVLGGPSAAHVGENAINSILPDNHSSHVLVTEAGMPSQNLPITHDNPNPPAAKIEQSNPNVLISEVKGVRAVNGYFESSPRLISDSNKEADIKALVDKLMPEVPMGLKENAKVSLPMILKALHDEGIDTPKVIAFALANCEPENDLKVDKEEIGGGAGFNYSGGDKWHARGLSDLTQDYNYEKYGKRLGIDLVNNPDLAKDERYSAKLYAAFLKDEGIADMVNRGEVDAARRKFGGDFDDNKNPYNAQILHYVIQRTNAYYFRMKN